MPDGLDWQFFAISPFVIVLMTLLLQPRLVTATIQLYAARLCPNAFAYAHRDALPSTCRGKLAEYLRTSATMSSVRSDVFVVNSVLLYPQDFVRMPSSAYAATVSGHCLSTRSMYQPPFAFSQL
jgi:hypothetical protein